jgi:hypothetical protein
MPPDVASTEGHRISGGAKSRATPGSLPVASSAGPMLAALAIDPLGASTSLVARLFPLVYLAGLVTLGLLVSLVLRRLQRVPGFRRVHPWIPLLHLAVWLPLVWLLQHRLVPTATGTEAWTRTLWLLALAVAGLPWLRNVFLGVVFAIEGRYRLGDDLRIGDLEGRFVAVGLRAITLRAATGVDIDVPYERLLGDAVVRLNIHDPAAPRAGDADDAARDSPWDLVFDIPPGVAPVRAAELARQAAALSRFASPRRPPEVLLAPRDHDLLALQLHVRGQLYDRDHGERFRSDLVERLHAAFAAELTGTSDDAPRGPQ